MDDARVAELNELRLATLTTDTRALAEKHIALCNDEGISLLVVQATRSFQEQSWIYAIGRSKPGKVVTNAAPGWSWHNFGRAYDVAVMVDGKPDWNRNAMYEKAGEIGSTIGLIWGGSFRHQKGDLGHFEYHPDLTLNDARAKAGFAE
jgi:peptidoglycan LD-endopeptidase CwlK